LPTEARVYPDAALEFQLVDTDNPGQEYARNAVVPVCGQYFVGDAFQTVPLLENMIPWKNVVPSTDAEHTNDWSGNVFPVTGAFVAPGIMGCMMTGFVES